MNAQRDSSGVPSDPPDWQDGQLRRLEELGRLAGTVAHDVNNLLTVIRSYAQLMLDQAAAGHPTSSEDAQEIERAAARGSELTRRLLAFARRQAIETRLVDVGEAIRGLEGMFRPQLGSIITLELRIEDDLPPVMVEPIQLDQVLLNLVSNAAQAMPEGGRLVIAAGRRAAPIADAVASYTEGTTPADPIAIEVTDTGSGMDAETIERAFEPFFTTRSASRGTGLGLSVVSGIVRRARGAVQVASTPGAGTTFRVLLPVAPSSELPADEDGPVPESLTCVMIVEDDANVRRATRRLLVEAGYAVALASNGSVARRRFESEWKPGSGPSVVLADIATPHEDGWALAHWLVTERPDVPVVLMSALEWHRSLLPTPPNVRTPILQKPFSAAELLTALASALASTPPRDKPR